jgi:uncharacterized SAM-binding protein YcdF (DUF218 family)
VAVFLLASFLVLIVYREISRIHGTPVTAWTQDVAADCAVVLTGQAYRIRDGLNLLYSRQVKHVIISGVHPGASLQDLFPLRPFYGDIPVENIVLEKRSMTTFGNAQQSLPLVEALRCRDIVLVTSHLHMYRALRTFRAIFPESIPILPFAIVSGRVRPEADEVLSEAFKSIFYSTWTYN